MTVTQAGERLAPVAASERNVGIDIVRGFALWGVLLVNMANYVRAPSGNLDTVAGWVRQFFFEQKSWHLFSFLFGLGFAVLMMRARVRGQAFVPLYLRRLVILLAFGLFNFLFYFGDVLTAYALTGMLLLLFRNWSPRWILIVALPLLMLHPVERALRIAAPADPEVAATSFSRTNVENVESFDRNQQRASAAATGTPLDYWRAQAIRIGGHVDPRQNWRGSESWLLFLAMFLLGLYAVKRGVLEDTASSAALIRRVCIVGLSFGFAMMTVDWCVRFFVKTPLTGVPDFARRALWSYGATALSLGYAAALVMLARRQRWRRFLSPLAAMGRMPLTVYLSQSIIFTTLFFGYGLGQDSRLGMAGIFGAAAIIYTCQLMICVWWAKRFRFGPAEWLWRTLTYLRIQPMRLERSPTVAPLPAAVPAV